MAKVGEIGGRRESHDCAALAWGTLFAQSTFLAITIPASAPTAAASISLMVKSEEEPREVLAHTAGSHAQAPTAQPHSPATHAQPGPHVHAQPAVGGSTLAPTSEWEPPECVCVCGEMRGCATCLLPSFRWPR